MNISYPVYTRLSEVLFRKHSLSEALASRKKTISLTPSEEEEVKKECALFLRRYFSLRYECSDILSQYEYESGEFLLSMIALSQLRMSSIKKEEIQAEYEKTFARLRFTGDPEKNRAALVQASSHPFRIPEERKKAPYYFNSLALERPEFLFRRFFDEFGSAKTLDRMQSLRKKSGFTYASRENGSLTDTLQKMDSNLSYDRYLSPKPLHRDSLRQRKLYPASYLECLAYSLPEIPQVSPKILRDGAEAAFSCYPIALSVKDSYEPSLVLNLGFYQRECVSLPEFPFVTPLHCENRYLKTYYPYDSFDVVIERGKDTGLGRIGKRPWLLPTITREDISDSKGRQLNSLLERSEFVKSQGFLLFRNHGLLKEETTEVVSLFLEKNNRFELVKEIQVLPDGKSSEGGYIALLRKK